MNYCEIFRTGEHTSANGTKKTWTVEDLDKIVNQFNEKQISAPIVIGHPKSNNPAYGWVESLKRNGEKLLASFKQVNQEFAEWVKDGLYKNRSISLYPDLTLRHVGFLGAMPPAVKGLAEFQFEENSEYEEYIIGNDKTNEREEENVEQDELKRQNAEFSEEITKKDAEIKELRDELSKKRIAEHEQFAEDLIQQGCITPAQKPYVVDFMEICTKQGSYDFSEGEEKDCLNAFKSLLKGMKQIDFSELATEENAGKTKPSESIDFNDGQSIAKMIQKKKAEYKSAGIDIAENVILNELKKGEQ